MTTLKASRECMSPLDRLSLMIETPAIEFLKKPEVFGLSGKDEAEVLNALVKTAHDIIDNKWLKEI
jgi:hypothetical protein